MEPDIGSARKKLQDSRTPLDNLLMKLPGFKGYMEYRERYASDRLLRTHLADAMIAAKGEVDAIARRLGQQGELKILPELNGINETLEKHVKTVQAADFGASSSLSSAQAKFSAADQDRLIAYDTTLLAHAETIRAAVDTLAAADRVDTAGIAKVLQALKAFERAFADRQHVLMGG
jgi:hypothetical protein